MSWFKQHWQHWKLRLQQASWLSWLEDFVRLMEAGLPVMESFELSLEIGRQQRGFHAIEKRLMAVHGRLQAGHSMDKAFVMDLNAWPEPIEIATRNLPPSGDFAGTLRRHLTHWQEYRKSQETIRKSMSYPACVLALVLLAWGLLKHQTQGLLLANPVSNGTGLTPSWSLSESLLLGGIGLAVLGLGLRGMQLEQSTRLAAFGPRGWRPATAWAYCHFFFEVASGLESGLDLLQCLRQSHCRPRHSAGKGGSVQAQLGLFSSTLERAIRQGQGFQQALGACRAPAFLLRQAALAERTGHLATCFHIASKVYELEARKRQSRLESTLGPLTLLLAAGFLTYAFQTTLAPMYAQLGQF